MTRRTHTDNLDESRQEFPDDWTGELLFPGIVHCVRARIARNLAGIPFPDRLSADGRRSVRDSLFRHVAESGDARWKTQSIEALEPDDRLRLQEESLVTPDLLKREEGIGLMVFSPDRRLGRRTKRTVDVPVASAMVNEEDHLRFQCVIPGGDLSLAWQIAFEMESALDGAVAEYAYDATYGYLTSCPSNLGTGLRVGMMMQLTGLWLSGDLDAALRGLDRLGLEARGIHGEDSQDAPGAIYQISNAETLGEPEEDILFRVSDLLRELARQEEDARVRLAEGNPRVLEDFVLRSVAIGRSARILSVDEAVSLHAAGVFGLEMGLLGIPDMPTPFGRMRPFCLPATTRLELGRPDMSDDELSALRADRIRALFELFATASA